jgi:hypothetical protein
VPVAVAVADPIDPVADPVAVAVGAGRVGAAGGEEGAETVGKIGDGIVVIKDSNRCIKNTRYELKDGLYLNICKLKERRKWTTI